MRLAPSLNVRNLHGEGRVLIYINMGEGKMENVQETEADSKKQSSLMAQNSQLVFWKFGSARAISETSGTLRC